MRDTAFCRILQRLANTPSTLLVIAVAVGAIAAIPHFAKAQDPDGIGDAGACTLRNHVYTCDGAAVEKALAGAGTVSLETHNSDGIARNALKDLVVNKLHKTLVPDGSPADLVFLLMPIDQAGQVENNTIPQDLGTLRLYSTAPDGRPAHLLWAETYTSDPSAHDMPWPLVARSVVAKFEKRFQIR